MLARQLRGLGLRDDCRPSADAWAAFLRRVDAAYTEADDDRFLLERSLAISSAEMADLYEELRSTSESRLAAEHARLVAVTEHSPIAMAEIDRYGRVGFENSACRAMIGASLVESGARVRDLLHPGDRRAMDRLARRARRDGRDERATMRFTRADGQQRWARIQLRALQDDDPRWFVAVTDVTEEIHARQERERLSLLLEATADLVALFDVTGQLLHLNRVGSAQLGVAPDESLAGRNVAELFDAVSRERLRRHAFPRMHRDGEWRGEATLAGPGGTTSVSLIVLAHHQPGGVEYCSAIARDVTELKEVQRELGRQATHDELTGLPNRALLLDRLTQAVLRARRRSDALGVLYIDLDRVKLVNDNLGHDAGDRVLVQAAERLRGCTRSPDTVGRLGGDEFVVVAEDLDDDRAVLGLADRVVEVFDQAFVVDGVEVYVTASVGVALRGGAEEASELLRDADVAMYRAKEGGGGRVELFDARMRAWVTERFETEHALRHALEHGGLGVHYQVQARPVTGEIVAFEALARWEHTPRGTIQPDLFIPLAEETGLIGVIGEQVTEEACRQAAQWNAAGPTPVGISVNVSVRQLTQPGLLELVDRALAGSGLDPARLTLEITESVLVQDPELASSRLEALRALGVRLAVDDFGKGYSSLAYLQRFPLDTVKIDQIFLQNLEPGGTDHTIVGSVIDLAHGLGFEVVAEGVETLEQLDALVNLGCDLVQGHVLAPALPAARGRRAARRAAPAGGTVAQRGARSRAAELMQ